MAKKIIGISLITLSILFLLTVGFFIGPKLISPREERIKKELTLRFPDGPPLYNSKEAIELLKDVDDSYNLKIRAVSFDTLFSMGIALIGFVLFKRGSKEVQRYKKLKKFD